jgi:hypothetical protein
MRHAVRRAACNSGLGAALVLAPLAAAMRLAVRRAASLNPLRTALQLALPPAHVFSMRRQNPTPLRRAIPAVTHPLSALSIPLVHTGQHTHDGGSARAGQTLGSACLIKVVKGTYGGRGDVRWVCSRAGWCANAWRASWSIPAVRRSVLNCFLALLPQLGRFPILNYIASVVGRRADPTRGPRSEPRPLEAHIPTSPRRW